MQGLETDLDSLRALKRRAEDLASTHLEALGLFHLAEEVSPLANLSDEVVGIGGFANLMPGEEVARDGTAKGQPGRHGSLRALATGRPRPTPWQRRLHTVHRGSDRPPCQAGPGYLRARPPQSLHSRPGPARAPGSRRQRPFRRCRCLRRPLSARGDPSRSRRRGAPPRPVEGAPGRAPASAG